MRKLGVLLAAVAICVFVTPAMAGGDCSCKTIHKTGTGWCEACSGGAVYGVEVKSEKLYSALEGKSVKNVDKIKCPGCKKAAKANGVCEGCHVAFNKGKVFHSPISQVLSKGKIIDAHTTTECANCRRAIKSGANNYCSSCESGIVGRLGFKDKELYKQGVLAMRVLKKAAKVASHCEGCAVAMVSDGQCPACKVQFKDGKKVDTQTAKKS